MTGADRRVRRAGADALARAHATIIREARTHVAAGRDPRAEALAARIRAAAARAREAVDADAAAVDGAERHALRQLDRIAAVHRARAALARTPTREPERARPAPAPRRPLLRSRPTITGNMDVHREASNDGVVLRWDPAPAVERWELRVSERPGPRPDYVVRDTRELPGNATDAEVRLGERPVRVHLLGRGRDGRLVRRAIVSALTRENLRDRWERRASAS